MERLGWRSRAAGWFTTPVVEGYLGVVALGAASKHAQPGTAFVTLHVGIRDEQTEPVVARLCSGTDNRYRSRTATTSIGCLLPERRWREWPISAENGTDVAAQLSEAVQRYAVPYLRELATDPNVLIDAAVGSPAYGQVTGWCRVAVLLARHRTPGEALAFVDEGVAALGERQDAAALEKRAAADALRGWLAGSPLHQERGLRTDEGGGGS